MEFNEVFQYIGDVGTYQMLLYVITGLLSFFNGLHNISSNFFAAPMEHWCNVPQLQNYSYDIQRHVAVPFESDGEGYDSCQVFDLDYDQLTYDDILSWDRDKLVNVSTVQCQDGWVYDQSELLSTISSKYDLVCDRSWMVELTSTIYMAGVLVGSLVSGVVSDRFGRKKPLIVSLLGYVVFSLVQAFAPNYTAFVIFRFFLSTFNMTSFLCGYVIIMELLGPKFYVMLATFVHIFFSFGFMMVAGLAYAVRDMEKLFICLSLPIICTFPFIWAVPESPRWLVSRGRYKEANKILKYIAQVNQVEFPDDVEWTDDSQKKEQELKAKGKCSDLCKSRILCSELALVYLNWFTVSLVYYGVSFNAGAFGDVYLNTFLSGLIEVPANIICWISMAYGGRRYANGASLLVTGLFCLSCIPVLLIRPDMQGLLTALSTLGKGAITFSFSSVYLYSSELFPTPVRHIALGSASMFARIGSMASPYLGSTLEDVWKPMPSVIFGALAVFTGSVVFLLPETKGKGLPDTIEDAEEIGRSQFRKGKGHQNKEKLSPNGDLVVVVTPEMTAMDGVVNDGYKDDNSTNSLPPKPGQNDVWTRF